MLRIYFAAFLTMSLQFAGQSTFVALGQARYAIFFSLFRKVILVIPLALILPNISGLGESGIFLSEPISDVIGGSASFITMLYVVRRLLAQEKENKKTEAASY